MSDKTPDVTDPYAAIAARAAEAMRALVDGFRTLSEAASRATQATRADYALCPPGHVEVLLDGEWVDLGPYLTTTTFDPPLSDTASPPQPATPPRPNRAQRRHRATKPDRPAWQTPYGPTRHH